MLYLSPRAMADLDAIRPVVPAHGHVSVFGLSGSQIGRRIARKLRCRGVPRRLQRSRPTGGHGPGPGRKRRGAARAPGGRPLGVPCDASPIHPLPGRCAGGRRHLLRQALTTTDQAVARRRGRTVPGPACIEPAPPPLRAKRTVREPEQDGKCPAPRGKPDAGSDGTGTVVKYCTTIRLANNTTITPRL